MPLHLSRVGRVALLGVALLALGCDGSAGLDAGPRPDGAVAEVELGTAMDSEFFPLTDGDELPYILGPQGGYHFLVSMRARGIVAGNPDMLTDPSNPRVSFRAWRGERRVDLSGGSTYIQGLRPAADQPGTYEMVGRLLILEITSCDDLTGDSIRVEVELEDVTGVLVRDEATVTAIPDPITCG